MYILSDGFGSGDGVGGQSERTNLRNPPVTHFIRKCTSHFGIGLASQGSDGMGEGSLDEGSLDEGSLDEGSLDDGYSAVPEMLFQRLDRGNRFVNMDLGPDRHPTHHCGW